MGQRIKVGEGVQEEVVDGRQIAKKSVKKD
jgi:hypothetical protein